MVIVVIVYNAVMLFVALIWQYKQTVELCNCWHNVVTASWLFTILFSTQTQPYKQLSEGGNVYWRCESL